MLFRYDGLPCKLNSNLVSSKSSLILHVTASRRLCFALCAWPRRQNRVLDCSCIQTSEGPDLQYHSVCTRAISAVRRPGGRLG